MASRDAVHVVTEVQRDERHVQRLAAASQPVEAFDRGRVTVVAPLNATQSLWAVLLAALVLGRSEAIGRRLVLAAVLVVAGGVLIGATR